MGADNFRCSAVSKTARDAFRSLVDEAYWECGHGGYTGTIAEKPGFQIIPLTDKSADEIVKLFEGSWTADSPECETLKSLFHGEAENLIAIFEEKWGDALCYEQPKGTFTFFGYASS